MKKLFFTILGIACFSAVPMVKADVVTDWDTILINAVKTGHCQSQHHAARPRLVVP